MRGFIPPQNREETVFFKKSLSMCEKADRQYIKSFSDFLNLRQKDLFQARANKFPSLNLRFYAGFEGDSERCMACVYNEYDSVDHNDYPIIVLKSKILTEDKLNHRDFLGAIMNLMIKREYIGDILVMQDECFIVCHTMMAPIIISELKKVKHSFVNFDYCFDTVSYSKIPSLTKNVTVASMRLDAVLSAVLNISRSNSAALVKQGNVAVNHFLPKHSDFEIVDGDILSVSGHGKYKLICDGSKSRKDRFFITYLKY